MIAVIERDLITIFFSTYEKLFAIIIEARSYVHRSGTHFRKTRKFHVCSIQQSSAITIFHISFPTIHFSSFTSDHERFRLKLKYNFPNFHYKEKSVM